ncbi:MAG: hypothetical protein HY671_05930 [Chloroflexi bacterium]|nr:hypothetical protein [Chloroflexota bacterium]
MRLIRLIRDLSLLVIILAGVILIVWGIGALLRPVLPGLGSFIDLFGKSFFGNPSISGWIKVSVPMLVLGLILFVIFNSQWTKRGGPGSAD